MAGHYRPSFAAQIQNNPTIATPPFCRLLHPTGHYSSRPFDPCELRVHVLPPSHAYPSGLPFLPSRLTNPANWLWLFLTRGVDPLNKFCSSRISPMWQVIASMPTCSSTFGRRESCSLSRSLVIIDPQNEILPRTRKAVLQIKSGIRPLFNASFVDVFVPKNIQYSLHCLPHLTHCSRSVSALFIPQRRQYLEERCRRLVCTSSL